jgi:hypothetical protein
LEHLVDVGSKDMPVGSIETDESFGIATGSPASRDKAMGKGVNGAQGSPDPVVMEEGVTDAILLVAEGEGDCGGCQEAIQGS